MNSVHRILAPYSPVRPSDNDNEENHNKDNDNEDNNSKENNNKDNENEDNCKNQIVVKNLRIVAQ